MVKTDFTKLANQRPNYFPGQYLLEDDFELQHKYLSDSQNYYNQSLHVSGIVEGLEVAVIQDKKAVQIKSGAAINNHGELIVLKEDINFAEFKDITNGELYIQYFEDKQVKQQEDIADSYTYKDTVTHDSKPIKKVIGQQIAEVFPQAVSTHTDVVPDIFQVASIADGWVSLEAHGLQVGERVRLLLEDSEPKICTIEAVTPESFQVSLEYEGEVFVYGREVNDFHVVDYDALSMLNISATQELYKIIDALKIEVQQLKAQLNGSHHPIAAFSKP